MFRATYPRSIVMILCVAGAYAAPEEVGKQQLQNAEAQLRATYEQVESQLDAGERSTLHATQEAWERYRKQQRDYCSMDNRGAEHGDEISTLLVWFRIGHLNRMLEHRDLKGTEADFRDADDAINKLYKAIIQSMDYRDWLEKMKEVERAWIPYRDVAAESESSVCPNRDSAAVYIKMELTYERIAVLEGWDSKLSQRLSSAPPDLEKEMYLTLLLNDSPKIRQKAVDYFCANATESLPLLIAQLRIGMLFGAAAPIFKKVGPDAIAPLLNLMDTSDRTGDPLPELLVATGPAVIPELIARISSDNPLNSGTCINTLALFGADAKDAIPTLLNYIRNPKRNSLRGVAAQAALKISPDNKEVARTIVDAYVACPTSYPREYFSLTNALGKLRRAAKDALPTLIQQERANNDSEAFGALISIISADDTDLIPSLMEGLVDPKNEHWRPFSYALSNMGNSAVPELIKLLQGPDETSARRAAATLSRLRQPSNDAIAALISLLNAEDTFKAIYFIDNIAELHESAKAAIPALLKLYRANRRGVSAAALHALRSIDPKSDEVRKLGLPEPFVTDPYYDGGCYKDIEPNGESTIFNTHFVFDADFNNDGIEDLAVSGPQIDFGTGGGPWNLYLKVADRKYKKVGEFGAGLGIKLFTKEKGSGYIRTYWHMNSSSGAYTLSKVTMDGIKDGKSVVVDWNGERERTVDRDEEIPIPKGYTEIKLSAETIERKSLLGK